MANVKTVREHQNLYGSKPIKAKGDEYELPDNLAKTLSDAGLVEAVKAKPAQAEGPKTVKP